MATINLAQSLRGALQQEHSNQQRDYSHCIGGRVRFGSEESNRVQIAFLLAIALCCVVLCVFLSAAAATVFERRRSLERPTCRSLRAANRSSLITKLSAEVNGGKSNYVLNGLTKKAYCCCLSLSVDGP